MKEKRLTNSRYCFVSGVISITGGAIKLTAAMQEREHTKRELDKLNNCRDFLKQNGVFDQDSFIDFIEEV